MSQSRAVDSASAGRIKFTLPAVTLFAILLFVLTYLGIQKSRKDSLELLRQQGVTLIESLALAADNAIKANSFFDLLVQEKFSDLAGFLESRGAAVPSSPELADFASGYGVDAILIFDNQMSLKASGARGVFIDLNKVYGYVIPELKGLLADSISQNSFVTIAGTLPGEVNLYYLSKSKDQQYITVIVSDALFYSQAKENIGIGFFVQKMAREVGVEYIIFQTADGIIFSSRKIGPLLKIEKDPFLKEALSSDSVMWRESVAEDRRILELVKRFTSVEYSEGIFRLGISLEKYYDIVAGYDRQMIVLSFVIFAVLVLIVLYLGAKQKRIYLDRSFQRMQSLSEKVFDSMNAGLVTIDKNGIIEMANQQFLAIFEIRENDIIGKSWAQCPFGGIIAAGDILSGRADPAETESIYLIPGGKKYLLVNTGRLYDYRNEITGLVAVIYDYSRIRELEDSARRKERLTELGDLAAGVAHEIRNPLNAISIAAQRLLGEFEPRENVEEFKTFAGQIRTEANRLNDIVTRFLAMAKDKGHIKERINISRVVDETVRLIALGLERKDITIRSNIMPDVFALVSEDRLKQLVMNLVMNGVEACEKEGGTVDLTLNGKDGQVILSVADTGSGIPEEIRKKVFSPYFTTKEKGTGLGLSIVHQIVEEFEGQISLVSRESSGAEFIIKFPA